ncbi:MAG: hypothetical protein NC187_03200 [Candidatus Amulumruptor caecigallinarius]|nr:hypothetical protein [Candidatus Amulumruptor caecigallinarius]MCM1396482.1 hypothetical protein [Candidatus Amulumruptor caecigallinarius]MCM1453461.1 hypothetical protein [bacterium]
MKSAKIYASSLRRLKRSRGFGVHSPFAFHFICRTLGERAPYYAYPAIAASRSLSLQLAHGVTRHPRIMSEKNAKMLFRVVCRFNPWRIFQIGGHFGLSTAAVMAVDSRSKLSCFMPANPHVDIFRCVTAPLADRINYVSDVAEGLRAYAESTPGTLFVMVCDAVADSPQVTASLCRLISERECVVAVRNLSKGSALTAPLWEALKQAMPYGMTFTNGNIGFLVALRHLPVQHFTLWF